MRTVLTLAGLFPLLLILSSCGICSKKVSCPAFEDDLLEAWFPLENLKSLSFKSTANQLQTFTFDVTTSKPYNVYQQGGGCSAYKQAISKKNRSFGAIGNWD